MDTDTQEDRKASTSPNRNDTSWSIDFYTTKGRKAENQDSILITSCLPYGFLESTLAYPDQSSLTPLTDQPLLVLIADGVSACQFPKQASQLVVNTIAHHLTIALAQVVQPADNPPCKTDSQPSVDFTTALTDLDDNQVAGLIKVAVNKANDSLYFPQVYQRVPPLLSTLSGLLCIGDRIHLFHTGDSRIYLVGVDSLLALSQDHRVHQGLHKGALSTAMGADTQVTLQQSVFTLHQNECLAMMTDGVYEHIEPAELQFELCAAAAILQPIVASHRLPIAPKVSQMLCEQALIQGSHDNLTMIWLQRHAQPTASKLNNPSQAQSINGPDDACKWDKQNVSSNDIDRYQLLASLDVGDNIDGFMVIEVIARTARSEVYLVEDKEGYKFVLKSPSLDAVGDGHYLREFLKERKIGLSLSKHRRAGEPAFNQVDPNNLSIDRLSVSAYQENGSALSASGVLRYYPVPASSRYLYHLTEYIEGESLRDFITHNAPCDIWQTYDLLVKIGMAVRVMHRHYLLHQDIKPENILLTTSGTVKLIDFGSASSLILKDSTRPPNGDLHYAAPEYYTDAPKGVHSDLFSIAVIGYELLTGQLPFSSQTLMSPHKDLTLPVQWLHRQRVPFASQQALMRAFHSSTQARYQAIGEFLQDFNPDNSSSINDPEPLIVRRPLLVWHSICFIEFVIILLLLAYIR
ncbi:protein kinase [Psychrobacter urativorans]|uniref:bifunctional serine/threonine-protein phosphatase/kinase n=1 Tax=Psychrobacter urativorans TaxID=45610 RepID=UPI00191AADBB|nr:bifunctional serine/threonine-protein phosphatase/kinase [Psychrobacter urativorans]